MATQAELQTILENLLNKPNVYYQPPESLKMVYPAIRYEKADILTDRADNSLYRYMTQYNLTVIDRHPDNAVLIKLLELPYCSYSRHYVADGLHHDVFTIYF